MPDSHVCDKTLDELEAALQDQLCGKYLRAREGRHGILLLVHQKQRPKGWRDHDAAMLSFNQVVERLQTLAVAIAASGFDAPQPKIAVLDVSSFSRSKTTTASKGNVA